MMVLADYFSKKTILQQEQQWFKEQPKLKDQLMKQAGYTAWMHAHQCWPDNHCWFIVCGPGNNGGDGLYFAHYAQAAQHKVTVLVADAQLKQSHRFLHRLNLSASIQLTPWSHLPIMRQGVWIDALFGIGLNRPVIGVYQEIVQRLNQSDRPILSLDIPSGLDADLGCSLGVCVEATRTLTFMVKKAGLFLELGRQAAGIVTLETLDINPENWQVQPLAKHCSLQEIQSMLPPLKPHAHKGSKGHHLLFGGMQGQFGALLNAADGAWTAGVGCITCVTEQDHLTAVACYQPQYMAVDWHNKHQILSLLDQAKALTFGPGLGCSAQAKKWLQQLGSISNKIPQVIDADGLNLMAKMGKMKCSSQMVLTPHPGEAARLLKTTSKAIQANRFQALRALVEKYQCTIVLKGAGTLVSAPGKAIYLCAFGNASMAVAGSGDLLAGLIGGFLTQGCSPLDAALLGVWLHALAADAAQSKQAVRSLTLAQWLKELHRLINEPV
jgi:ADP-dependent NAD(P)H-hydrate dehydratase / NAD(P)H-hydrate epimerase